LASHAAALVRIATVSCRPSSSLPFACRPYFGPSLSHRSTPSLPPRLLIVRLRAERVQGQPVPPRRAAQRQLAIILVVDLRGRFRASLNERALRVPLRDRLVIDAQPAKTPFLRVVPADDPSFNQLADPSGRLRDRIARGLSQVLAHGQDVEKGRIAWPVRCIGPAQSGA